MLMRPTLLGSLSSHVALDKPKVRPRVAAKSPVSKDTKKIIADIKNLLTDTNTKVPAKKAAAKKKTTKPVDRTKPDNFGYVLEKAVPKQCNAWTQTIGDKKLGLVRFYVNAPRGQRFKANGLHGAYRSAYALSDGTWDWVGTKNGFIDLRKIVENGFYYCHDSKCEFPSCPQSYRGPRTTTASRKKAKPNRGEGMLFSPDGTGNKVTWDDDGMMVIEPVTPEFHSFETVR